MIHTKLKLLLISIFLCSYPSLNLLASIYINGLIEFTSSNWPIIVINTNGQLIVDERRIVANMGIIDNGIGKRNFLTDAFNTYNGRIAIELRGSSSMAYPKQQYRFETQDLQGNNLNVILLGMPAENDWILYGPYVDQSHIRNVLAYKLSNLMGRYASRTRFCELVLNGDYRGLYVLIEKIKRDKNRVNIAELDSLDIQGEAVSGGYIIKIDKQEGENVGGWYSKRGIAYQYHYPAADEILPAQKTYIRNFMEQFETVMASSQRNDPEKGFLKLIDLDSFVDHFLLNEFCKNIDAYRISAFLHKDRDRNDSRLKVGPIWDFNLSMGRTWYPEDALRYDEWEIHHNSYKPNDSPKVPFWWEILGHTPAFATRAQERWWTLRKTLFSSDYLFSTIDSLTASIQEARIRNFERWPGSGSNQDYAREIQVLKGWLIQRTNWIDSNISKLMTVDPDSPGIVENFSLKQNYPNPFNATTQIQFYLSKAATVELTIYNILGQAMTTCLYRIFPAGLHTYKFDASDFPPGLYIYQIKVENFQASRKMLLIK